MKKNLSVGIDTSNYKTSAAVVDENGEILFNHQQLLNVKKGERGLRQSEALFQHVQNLPPVFEELFKTEMPDGSGLIRDHIGAVSVSTRPRPVEGSYMPVFTAGHGYARALAAGLGVPLYEFSHQEGHIEAIRHYSELRDVNPLICFHFSGGTTEAILVDGDNSEIVGGSRDLAYGQVLDRIGVALGLEFPAGDAMDKIAMSSQGHRQIFTKIKVKDGYVNLSGIETQGQRLLREYPQMELLDDLFETVSESIMEMTLQLSSKYDIHNFIYAGGVSCSRYMRQFLSEHLYRDLNIAFGKNELSSDNAIGVALLGGKKIWL
jgi:N6-L-threonylcarbamoyladenine synthase